ncbi:MAG: sensory box protein [Rickettsiaceae bacterium]|jgi:hypothetical protein|nr:sensory box protein [Rickettsiaceae bacterium]
MIELRLTTRLTQYWQRIRKDADVPAMNVFNSQMVHDLWGKCIVLNVTREDGKANYYYKYIGEDLSDVFGDNLVGQRVKAQLHFLPAKKMLENFDDMLQNPRPKNLDGQFVDQNNHLVKYRSCILPFGTDKQNVTNFVIGISWNSFK